MAEAIKPFRLKKAGHYPIRGMKNPTTPIEHVAGAQGENIQKVTDEKGEGVLPEIKVREIKPN